MIQFAENPYVVFISKNDFFERDILKEKYEFNTDHNQAPIYFQKIIEQNEKYALFEVTQNSRYFLLKGIKNKTELVNNEIQILRNLVENNIKNVPKIIQSSVIEEDDTNASAVILLEYLDIENYAKMYDEFSAPEKILIILKSIDLIHELHKNKIYVKNICVNNILIDRNNLKVFIYDFSKATNDPSKYKSIGDDIYKSREQIFCLNTIFGSDWFSMLLVSVYAFSKVLSEQMHTKMYEALRYYDEEYDALTDSDQNNKNFDNYIFPTEYWDKIMEMIKNVSDEFQKMGGYVYIIFMSLMNMTEISEIENESESISNMFLYVENSLTQMEGFDDVVLWLKNWQNRNVQLEGNREEDIFRVHY